MARATTPKDDAPADPAADDIPPPEGEGAVSGTIVTLEAVQPSSQQINATRKTARSRTAAQAFSGLQVVLILCWVLRLRGVDLNPLPGESDMPGDVGAAIGSIITWTVCWFMNRPVSDDER